MLWLINVACGKMPHYGTLVILNIFFFIILLGGLHSVQALEPHDSQVYSSTRLEPWHVDFSTWQIYCNEKQGWAEKECFCTLKVLEDKKWLIYFLRCSSRQRVRNLWSGGVYFLFPFSVRFWTWEEVEKLISRQVRKNSFPSTISEDIRIWIDKNV